MKTKSLLLFSFAAIFGTGLPLLADDAPAPADSSATQKVFDVKDYGAVSDGQTICTVAIQKAMDTCSQAGGGIVKLSPGTYLTGHLDLPNDVTLSLGGATLLGSTNMADFPKEHLIGAKGAHNITLLGPGTIDGQGVWPKKNPVPKVSSFFWVPQRYYGHPKKNPGDLVQLFDCSGVKISNLTLQNSYSWTCHIAGCSNVSIDHLTIRNPIHTPNTDGIDVDASQDVQISNADIYTGDDAICIKNRNGQITYPHACKNITITNCKLTSPTNAFKIGTETYGDIENVVFRDSVVQAGNPTDPLSQEAAQLMPSDVYGNGLGPEAGIAVESADGSHISGVTVKNIVMHGARAAVFIRLCDRGVNPVQGGGKVPAGTIEGVTISNVTDDGASCASSITGIPGHPVGKVTISNLQVTYVGNGTTQLAPLNVPERDNQYPGPLAWGPLPSYGLYLHHAGDVEFSNVSFTNAQPDTRTAIIADDVSGLKLDGFILDPAATADPLIILNNVRDSGLRGTVPQSTKTWVQVSGANSGNITLQPIGPQTPGKPFDLAPNVPANAVTLQSQ